ncbi:hydroxymethylglutaryl-CoA synthase [Enterococcus faecium]|nr:hydroxymethylglutaryl-CoA synthase [Enterococcus faecium]
MQSVLDQTDEGNQERLLARYEESIRYSRRIGNLYTGSLYLGLTSLLENSKSLQPGDRIGLFSYGSGAVSEFLQVIWRKTIKNISSHNLIKRCWILENESLLTNMKRFSANRFLNMEKAQNIHQTYLSRLQKLKMIFVITKYNKRIKRSLHEMWGIFFVLGPEKQSIGQPSRTDDFLFFTE